MNTVLLAGDGVEVAKTAVDAVITATTSRAVARPKGARASRLICSARMRCPPCSAEGSPLPLQIHPR